LAKPLKSGDAKLKGLRSAWFLPAEKDSQLHNLALCRSLWQGLPEEGFFCLFSFRFIFRSKLKLFW